MLLDVGISLRAETYKTVLIHVDMSEVICDIEIHHGDQFRHDTKMKYIGGTINVLFSVD